jgi:hypothetical protein
MIQFFEQKTEEKKSHETLMNKCLCEKGEKDTYRSY